MTTVPVHCLASHPKFPGSVQCRLIDDGHGIHYGTDKHTAVGHFWEAEQFEVKSERVDGSANRRELARHLAGLEIQAPARVAWLEEADR